MHTTLPPLGNPPQRGSVVYMHTYMGNGQRKEPKEMRGLCPLHPQSYTRGLRPSIPCALEKPADTMRQPATHQHEG